MNLFENDFIMFTIRIFEKLINFLSDISCELSSINVKSDKYKPRYGTHGGSTLEENYEKILIEDIQFTSLRYHVDF
jgi:hypothetical protein